MTTNLTPDPLSDVRLRRDTTVVSGRDVLDDPGLVQLRRYLPVLAVIAAPYAGLGGDQEPLNPLDPAGEWDSLIRMLAATTKLQADGGTRLALVRLEPPTSAWLGAALAADAGGPDAARSAAARIDAARFDAYRVVHFVCHGERDMLYLEDEDGHEAYAVAEHVVNLFQHSRVQVVMMDGCFSRRMAQMLVDETPVAAVIGTRRRVTESNASLFAARFYAELTGGSDVRKAYRAALGELKRRPDGQADRYDLVIDEDVHEVTLPLPDGRIRAARPLIAGGMPCLLDVPQPVGFVGRREELNTLAEAIPTSGHGAYVLHGPAGIGKSWLAAAFAARFGWRFADGVVWFHCNAMTTAQEVAARLARVLDLPGHTPLADLVAALRTRRVLLVLDQVDALASWAELERLGTLIRDVAASGAADDGGTTSGASSWVLVTARDTSGLLRGDGESLALDVLPFTPKESRTLAMRLAVERNLDVLDVDTIDDFLERTLNLPWLITQAIEMVEAQGMAYALEDLLAFQADEPDLPGLFARRQLRQLSLREDRALNLLVRSQGLPDAMSEDLARRLCGEGSDQHIQTLVGHGLLQHDGALLVVPDAVRTLVIAQVPLTGRESDQVDRAIMEYLARTWPGDSPAHLDRAIQARLNNVRALIQRQIRPDSAINPAVMARVLVAAAPACQAAGLGEEFAAYAQGFREKLAVGTDLARLQLAMGDVLGDLPGNKTESGWLYRVTLRLVEDVDRATTAQASLAYGRHLVGVGQLDEACEWLGSALKALLSQVDRGDVRLAAQLAHEWAKALAQLSHHKDAVRRYEAALAGYAETRDAAGSALCQRDLSVSLVQVGEIDRAEDVLRRAMATADYIDRRDLAADIRQQLAAVYVTRANMDAESTNELRNAELALNDAVADCLSGDDAGRLAAICLALGRVQARLGQLDDAVAAVRRSRARYDQTGHLRDQTVAAITLGQLELAQGDSLAAETALHEALDSASVLGDDGLVRQAAGVLVRLHQLRARYAGHADTAFLQSSLNHARDAQDRLAALGLADHAAALGQVVAGLART